MTWVSIYNVTFNEFSAVLMCFSTSSKYYSSFKILVDEVKSHSNEKVKQQVTTIV